MRNNELLKEVRLKCRERKTVSELDKLLKQFEEADKQLVELLKAINVSAGENERTKALYDSDLDPRKACDFIHFNLVGSILSTGVEA